jgi:hypothetical protein
MIPLRCPECSSADFHTYIAFKGKASFVMCSECLYTRLLNQVVVRVPAHIPSAASIHTFNRDFGEPVV